MLSDLVIHPQRSSRPDLSLPIVSQPGEGQKSVTPSKSFGIGAGLAEKMLAVDALADWEPCTNRHPHHHREPPWPGLQAATRDLITPVAVPEALSAG